MCFLCYDEPMATFGNLGAQSGITRAPSYGVESTVSGGASMADENAPVFVRSSMELGYCGVSLHTNWVTKACLYFIYGALPLYMGAFTIAESWFPGLYRAWADWVLPLAEFVGSLTPRTGRITEQLISHGYHERAEFALHAIGMSRAITLPYALSAFVAIFVFIARTNKTPLVVACTRKTRTHCLLHYFGMPFVAFLCMLPSELLMGESFYSPASVGGVTSYHQGKSAILFEMIAAFWVAGCLFFMVYAPVLGIRTHFHIVEEASEEI